VGIVKAAVGMCISIVNVLTCMAVVFFDLVVCQHTGDDVYGVCWLGLYFRKLRSCLWWACYDNNSGHAQMYRELSVLIITSGSIIIVAVLFMIMVIILTMHCGCDHHFAGK
jgi:hypothetical protein